MRAPGRTDAAASSSSSSSFAACHCKFIRGEAAAAAASYGIPYSTYCEYTAYIPTIAIAIAIAIKLGLFLFFLFFSLIQAAAELRSDDARDNGKE